MLAGITVALSLGIPAGTAPVTAFGWRTGFAALTVLAVVVAVWVRLKVPGFPGVVLNGAGVGALPWTALPLVATALTTVLLARRHAFPGRSSLPHLCHGGMTAFRRV